MSGPVTAPVSATCYDCGGTFSNNRAFYNTESQRFHHLASCPPPSIVSPAATPTVALGLAGMAAQGGGRCEPFYCPWCGSHLYHLREEP